MPAALPEHIEPLQLARQDLRLQGSLPLARMSRLAAELVGDSGEARITWHFHLDLEGRPVLEGHLEAEPVLRCQRCLEPVVCEIKAEVYLGILSAGQSEDTLPLECEPLPITGEPMSLREMVEDELLLALPLAPLHSVCPRNEYRAPVDEVEEPEVRPNPFVVLQGWNK